MNLAGLICPCCSSKNIHTDPEWWCYCVDCGAMPNEDGYSTEFNAVRAFKNFMKDYTPERYPNAPFIHPPAPAGTAEKAKELK